MNNIDYPIAKLNAHKNERSVACIYYALANSSKTFLFLFTNASNCNVVILWKHLDAILLKALIINTPITLEYRNRDIRFLYFEYSFLLLYTFFPHPLLIYCVTALLFLLAFCISVFHLFCPSITIPHASAGVLPPKLSWGRM